MGSRSGKTAFQIKVALAEVSPLVWRRILVRGAGTLEHLHSVIQAAVGWSNSHAHEFKVEGVRYSDLCFELDGVVDERDACLADLGLTEGTELQYVYDFGDNWVHEVEVEKVEDLQSKGR